MKIRANRHTITILLIACLIVAAGCSGGHSSSTSTIVVPPVTLLAAPTAVSAVAGNQNIALSWNAVPQATSYTVYWSSSSSVTKQTGSAISGIAAAAYLHSGLTNSTTYYYVVTATKGPVESSESAEVSATPALPLGGPVTISGMIKYQDKEYGSTGFTVNMPYKAVRYAEVDIVPVSAPASKIASGITSSTGSYAITLPAAIATNVYVRVYSTATVSGDFPIAVKSIMGALYAPASSNFTPTGDTTVNIAIPVLSSAGGAFNILDVLTSGYEFIDTWAGSTPYPLSAYWVSGNPSYGTWYCDGSLSPDCPQGTGIYVLSNNSSGDTDEYDDDVLWHEFGHFTAAHFSRDTSQGGQHYLTDNDLDLRLSWSEGWGDFFPGAVKRWLKSVDPARLSSAPTLTLSQYVDTVGSLAGISFNMGDPDHELYSSQYYYSSNEVAVAKVLLDLQSLYGMQSVWDVIHSSSFKKTNPDPVNLESFWDTWKLRLSFLSEQPALENIYSGRKIYYKEDDFEPAGDDLITAVTRTVFPGTVSVPMIEQHTLYKNDSTPDKDLYRFSANAGQQFTIQTTERGTFKNGADTYIKDPE